MANGWQPYERKCTASAAVGQLPAFFKRTAMDRAAGQRLAGIHIGHLGIELKRLLHRLQGVFRKAESVAADDIDVRRAHRVADLADIYLLKAPLGEFLVHQPMPARRNRSSAAGRTVSTPA